MPTFTNPENPSETYTTGHRGKPSQWVLKHPAYIAYKADKVSEAPKVAVKTKPEEASKNVEVNSNIQYWKWIGVAGEDNVPVQATNQCYVAAYDIKQALEELNKTFKIFAVSKLEFDMCWKKIPGHDMMAKEVGAYQFIGGEAWEKRPAIIRK